MTEAEWLACVHPTPMLAWVREKARKRKLKLFCVACCRRLQCALIAGSRKRLFAVERSAELKLSADETETMADDAMAYADGLSNDMGTPVGCAEWLAACAVWHASESNDYQTALEAALCIESFRTPPEDFSLGPAPPSDGDPQERAAQAALARCIFGPRSRRFHSFSATWRSAVVLQLAERIYAEHAFERLPMLGDALEDSGCTNRAILDHCRQPGEHVRGCWVVDLVLGKS